MYCQDYQTWLTRLYSRVKVSLKQTLNFCLLIQLIIYNTLWIIEQEYNIFFSLVWFRLFPFCHLSLHHYKVIFYQQVSGTFIWYHIRERKTNFALTLSFSISESIHFITSYFILFYSLIHSFINSFVFFYFILFFIYCA